MKARWLLIGMASLFCLLFFIFTQFNPWHNAPDEIIEINTIDQVYKYLDQDDYNPETLVILDIDNTLLMPPTDLGSDQWFYAMYQRYLAKGYNKQDAVYAVLPVYKQVILETDFVPVEKETVSLVKKLQNKNVTVIGLTARSLDLCYRTIEQLDKVGIRFDVSNPHECPIKYGTDKPALYVDGIIFCGNYNKGEVLVSWLKQIDYQPSKVIFVDDKLKNVKSVERALHKRDFPFYGLRYANLDDRVAQFDWNHTQKELKKFLKKHPESRPIPAY
jgi:hypothetical protein